MKWRHADKTDKTDDILTHTEIVGMLREKQGSRTLTAFAHDIGIAASYLSNVYNGKRELNDTLMRKIGVEPQIVYKRWR